MPTASRSAHGHGPPARRRYQTFGSQALSDAVLRALPPGTKACLMANHGMVAYSSNLDKAFGLATTVEQLARQCVVRRTPSFSQGP